VSLGTKENNNAGEKIDFAGCGGRIRAERCDSRIRCRKARQAAEYQAHDLRATLRRLARARDEGASGI
jgi:hypothetical protein